MNRLAAALHLATRELAAHLKSRWILTTGSVSALLSWVVAFHGLGFANSTMGQETVLVSLVHLQLYIVPLLGLLLAYDGILGERDTGMFDLHLALGVDLWSFLAGKWIGLLASLAIALSPSLVIQIAGLLVAGGNSGQVGYLLFYAGLLSGAVVSLGLLASSLSLNRGTVISLCIGIWLLQAVLLDFLVIGLLTATDGEVPTNLVNILVAAHPLGAYRLLSYLTFFPDQVAALIHAESASLLGAHTLLAAWIVGPLAVTGYRLTRIYKPMPLELD